MNRDDVTYEKALVDFGIIAALPEEMAAVKKAFRGFPQPDYRDARAFYHKRINARRDPSRVYHVVATFLNQMGQPEAQSATRDLLEAWRPQHIILTGLAGALHPKIELADIIISDWILYYGPSKLTPAGPEPRSKMYPANAMLLNRMTSFTLDDPARRRWQKSCKSPNNRTIQHFTGGFASGESVIADEGAKADLKKQYGKLAGVEMEAAGTFAAAFNSADPRRVIMVRGVCDRADARKTEIDNTDLWRMPAAFNAAKFVEHFIRFGNVDCLNTDRLELKISIRPQRDPRLGRRTGFSYPFFEKIMTPQGPLLDVTLHVRVLDEGGAPLRILRAIWAATTAGKTDDRVIPNGDVDLAIPIKREKPDWFSLHLEVAGAAKRFCLKTSGAVKEYFADYRC